MSVPTLDRDRLWDLANDVEDEVLKLREQIAVLHCAHVGRQAIDAHAGSDIPEPHLVERYFDHGIARLVDELNVQATRIVNLVHKAVGGLRRPITRDIEAEGDLPPSTSARRSCGRGRSGRRYMPGVSGWLALTRWKPWLTQNHTSTRSAFPCTRSILVLWRLIF